ncbi:MAG: hypothetical protein ABJP48_04900 [Erythrobacter sp.]
MSLFTRRLALRSALGVAAIGMAGVTSRAIAQPIVPLPDQPMRLTRRLIRGLSGGSNLIVEREWQILFSATETGISISGNQIGVIVDTPPAIEQLAQIERQRSTADFFPILLTDAGEIATAGRFTREQDVDLAVSAAEDVFAHSANANSENAQRVQYLAQLHRVSGSIFQQFPPDLFYPRGQDTRTVRPVELPDGSVGEFELTYTSRAVPELGWLEHAQRDVITRIGYNARQSSEIWSLARI